MVRNQEENFLIYAPVNCFRDRGRAGDPREIDWAKSPLGQRFDRQLYPASEEIDNPREN